MLCRFFIYPYNSGNIDVQNWVHRFESPCIYEVMSWFVITLIVNYRDISLRKILRYSLQNTYRLSPSLLFHGGPDCNKICQNEPSYKLNKSVVGKYVQRQLLWCRYTMKYKKNWFNFPNHVVSFWNANYFQDYLQLPPWEILNWHCKTKFTYLTWEHVPQRLSLFVKFN